MSNDVKRMLVILRIIQKTAQYTTIWPYTCGYTCWYSCYCSDRGLGSVPQDLPTDITSLNLRNNIITTLNQSDFFRYSSLTWLDLRSNQISTINSGAFYNLSGLTYLNLNNNQLTSLRADMFVGLDNLTALQLDDNSIHIIEGNAFVKLPRLQTLSLSQNSLHTFTLTMYDSFVNISSVDITNNPWQCDCRMLPFKQRMTGVPAFERQLRCAGPANLEGRSLHSVDTEDLICDETGSSTGDVTGTSVFSLPLFFSALGGALVGAFLASAVYSAMWCKIKKRETTPNPVKYPRYKYARRGKTTPSPVLNLSVVDTNTQATAEV